MSSKKKPGRKPVADRFKSKNRGLRFTDADWAALTELAHADGCSVAELIRRRVLGRIVPRQPTDNT